VLRASILKGPHTTASFCALAEHVVDHRRLAEGLPAKHLRRMRPARHAGPDAQAQAAELDSAPVGIFGVQAAPAPPRSTMAAWEPWPLPNSRSICVSAP